jgi:hypothetical protein
MHIGGIIMMVVAEDLRLLGHEGMFIRVYFPVIQSQVLHI